MVNPDNRSQERSGTPHPKRGSWTGILVALGVLAVIIVAFGLGRSPREVGGPPERARFGEEKGSVSERPDSAGAVTGTPTPGGTATVAPGSAAP